MERIIYNNVENLRLDIYLKDFLNISRSSVTKMIKEEKILVNNLKTKSGYILKNKDIIEYEYILEKQNLLKQNIKLDIIYEDEDIMVINKPSGLVVHPGNGVKKDTLVNGLLNYTSKLSNRDDPIRPGIVHRIDKDTSGLLLITKTDESYEIMKARFKKHNIKRKYIALVSGVIEHNSGKINAPIGRDEKNRIKYTVTEKNSKNAITNFTVMERYKDATLIKCILETGRTHQIRVHMKYINHPIINDPVYGKMINESYGQMLHAYYIGFNHPITNEFLEFKVDIDKTFNKILDEFKNS